MKPFHRRDLLRCLSVLPFCSATGFADDAPMSVVVDTHLHCFAGQDRQKILGGTAAKLYGFHGS